MLTAAQAGKVLGLSARTMYTLAKAGKVQSLPVGRALRFEAEHIEAYRVACRIPAKVAPPAPPAPPLPPPRTYVRPAPWDDPDSAAAKFFWPDGRPAPVPPPPPAPVLSPAERRKRMRKQRQEEERLRREARRALVLFHANKRRAAKLNRTPPWSDLDAMRAIYEQARRLTVETGIQHHVDHVIPLQGKRVSGLHVPGNLQILTGSENSKKRNRYEP